MEGVSVNRWLLGGLGKGKAGAVYQNKKKPRDRWSGEDQEGLKSSKYWLFSSRLYGSLVRLVSFPWPNAFRLQ